MKATYYIVHGMAGIVFVGFTKFLHTVTDLGRLIANFNIQSY